jgi:hypothetical protein
MKKTRFTDQQIAFALQQAEAGTPVPEVCRKMGVSEPTFYRWKQKLVHLACHWCQMRFRGRRRWRSHGSDGNIPIIYQWIVVRIELIQANNVGGVMHDVSLSWRGLGTLDSRLDTSPF